MKPKIVNVPSTKNIIQLSPGFKKKELADYKVDLLALCGFGCRYCSSNEGYYLRMNWEKGENFKKLAEEQLGRKFTKKALPSLTFEWPDVLEKLEKQLRGESSDFGKDKVLVFSQLTDGFSERLVNDGTTKKALDILLEMTSFKIRVLTKNAIVGEQEWIDYFLENPDRFTVGLSIGSLDDKWSKKMELGTSSPSKRITALSNLQDAGVPTYGMLCPVFPDLLEGNNLEKLIDKVNPYKVEDFWAEPYNDRNNWELVRDSYLPNCEEYKWFNKVFGNQNKGLWSDYAMILYERLIAHSEINGWTDKLKYLLYEGDVTKDDVKRLGDFTGILFQSLDKKTGLSKNSVIAALQMQFDETIKAEIEALDQTIHNSIKSISREWITIGKSLALIQEKIEGLGSGKHFWQTYLGVDSFQDYCKNKLEITRQTATQMRQAYNLIQSLKPELLENEESEIPSYTKVRALIPHSEKIIANPEKYSDLIDTALISNATRDEVISKTKSVFPKQIIPIKTSHDQGDDEIQDWDDYVDKFEENISNNLSSKHQNRFVEIMNVVREMLNLV